MIMQHRLRKELRNISREPPPHITARPLASNILKWYFVLEGPSGTPYEGGIFMGRLQFPEQYPYKPPGMFGFIFPLSVRRNDVFMKRKLLAPYMALHPDF